MQHAQKFLEYFDATSVEPATVHSTTRSLTYEIYYQTTYHGSPRFFRSGFLHS